MLFDDGAGPMETRSDVSRRTEGQGNRAPIPSRENASAPSIMYGTKSTALSTLRSFRWSN